MSECQAGGCVGWVHVLDDELDIDYCCCIDPEWQRVNEDMVVCGTCDLPIYKDERETQEVPGVL